MAVQNGPILRKVSAALTAGQPPSKRRKNPTGNHLQDGCHHYSNRALRITMPVDDIQQVNDAARRNEDGERAPIHASACTHVQKVQPNNHRQVWRRQPSGKEYESVDAVGF